MKISGTASSLLQNKRTTVFSVTPDTTVFEAIKIMAHKNIGAVLVMDGDRLVGVMSERDYTRKIALKGKSSKDTPVRDILSAQVISVTPFHPIEDCMKLMTENRIRHLPVVEEGRVVGIISIGDLVNWIISTQSAVLDQMEQYLTGGFPVA
jgi:CBS domain-containing protein